MGKTIILGVQITSRVKNVPDVQAVLTEHGCNIKTRLGLHDVGAKSCSPSGLLIIETFGKEAAVLEMATKLKKIKGVKVQKMVFDA